MNKDRDAADRLNLGLIKQDSPKRDIGVSALYRAHCNELKRFLKYKYFKVNAEDIDDIVQKTFIKIVQNCESYRGESSPWTWMCSIASNCCIDHFRTINAHPTENLNDAEWSVLEKGSAELQVTNNVSFSADNLEDCFSKGFREFAEKEPDRAYALSLVVNEFDMINISNFLNRSQGATREYLSQCRKKIKEFLEPCREYLSPS